MEPAALLSRRAFVLGTLGAAVAVGTAGAQALDIRRPRSSRAATWTTPRQWAAWLI